MNVGDIVYAKHPRMYKTDKPGIVVKIQPMFKRGHRYQIMFPGIGLQWIKWTDNLIRFEDMWED